MAFMLRPANEGEVVALIHCARAGGQRLRVHGARHSVAPSIGTGEPDGLELSLERLASVRVEGARAIVGGGARIGADPLDRTGTTQTSLLQTLALHDLALPNLGGVASQTLAGFLATGSAGGSFTRNLADSVRRVRFVDGTGVVHDVERGHPLFPLAGTALGLLGVVTEIELETEPSYEVAGEETVVLRDEAPFDLRAPGAVSDFLERHEYARILWWPQPGAQRFAIWSARRVSGRGEVRPYHALPVVLGSERPAQRLAALGLRTLDGQPSPRWARLLIDAFVARGNVPFRDRWDRALPMDGSIDERTLPVEFAELWFPRADAHEALARLDDLFARDGFDATGNFAVELYAGGDSPFVMSPGHREPSVRINVFHGAKNRGSAAARFSQLWELFSDLAPRLHWGKHLPPPPGAARWLTRAWPELDRFLQARAELDPDGVFLNDYLRERLGVATSKPSSPRAANVPLAPVQPDPPRARWSWPQPFDLEPVGLEFPPRATRRLVYTADCSADPAFLFDTFVHMDEGATWMDQFVSMTADGRGAGTRFDETFTFMTLRGRTLVYDRPRRWVARIEACSLPLATRMIEELELVRRPGGRTAMSWTFSFDPHPLARPLERVLLPAFDRLFQKGLHQLGRFAEQRAGIHRELEERA